MDDEYSAMFRLVPGILDLINNINIIGQTKISEK